MIRRKDKYMESIFESLENLNVSKECFEDIVGLVEEYINELEADTIKSLQAKRERNSKEGDKLVHRLSTDGNKHTNAEWYKALGASMEADNKLSKARKAITKWASRHPEVPSKTKTDDYFNTYTKLINEPKYSNEKPDPETLVFKHK